MTKVDEPVGNLSRSLPRSPLSKLLSTSGPRSAQAPDGKPRTLPPAPDGGAAGGATVAPVPGDRCRRAGHTGGGGTGTARREAPGRKRGRVRHRCAARGGARRRPSGSRASPRFGAGPCSRLREGYGTPVSEGAIGGALETISTWSMRGPGKVWQTAVSASWVPRSARCRARSRCGRADPACGATVRATATPGSRSAPPARRARERRRAFPRAGPGATSARRRTRTSSRGSSPAAG